MGIQYPNGGFNFLSHNGQGSMAEYQRTAAEADTAGRLQVSDWHKEATKGVVDRIMTEVLTAREIDPTPYLTDLATPQSVSVEYPQQ